jgi:hypothetical protein
MVEGEKKRLDELLQGLDDADSGLSSAEVSKLDCQGFAFPNHSWAVNLLAQVYSLSS